MFAFKEPRNYAQAGVAQLLVASSHTLKGRQLTSQSGHIPRLQVQSPVGSHMEGNRSMFLSHTDVSLSLSLSLPLPLKPIIYIYIFFLRDTEIILTSGVMGAISQPKCQWH